MVQTIAGIEVHKEKENKRDGLSARRVTTARSPAQSDKEGEREEDKKGAFKYLVD